MTPDPLSNPEMPLRKRRVRYKGKNPRHFDEKYKEHDPERYADDVAKIIQSGKTPAGTHRPIMVHEILGVLDPHPGQTVLDATLGYGGHAEALLERIAPKGCLWGIDVDPIEIKRTEARLQARGFTEQVFKVRRINFAGVPKILSDAGGGFDLILADLGVSSMQLDDPTRGFTFKREGPLDLRLNPERGQPASALLQSLSEKDFAKMLSLNADEPYALGIARAVFKCRKPVTTTTALADAVRRALPRASSEADEEERTRSIRRTFQAIRIAVNDEFFVLEQFLKNLPVCLKPAGRAAILTFHPGEEDRVLRSFRDGVQSGVYAEMNLEPIRPTAQEQYDNSRSRSARLHWVKRCAG
jgi:16S rRNA (cytosine1402-N4)-methyltransferase